MRARGLTAWQVLRWIVVVAWMAVMVAGLALGSRVSTWDELVSGLATKQISDVRITGAMGGPDGFPHHEQGSATVDLSWTEQGIRHVATVEQVAGDVTPSPDEENSHLINGRVDTPLKQINPDVRLTWSDARPEPPTTLLGRWKIEGTWGDFIFLLWPLNLFLLATGPEPRTATRWAWFWLISSPLGMLVIPVFLLWGARGYATGRTRLTGGWAFLLFWISQAVSN